MRFTLKQLQAFVSAAQDSNVSSAAKALSLSQSAVSAAIGELESQFGRPLFDRIGKRLQLNETGKQLLPKAINLLTQAQELEQYARSGEATGNFRVGATLTIGNYLAAQLLSDYMATYPTSRIQLKVANTSQIIEGMRRFEIDVGLIEGECYHPDIQALPWCDDEMVVFFVLVQDAFLELVNRWFGFCDDHQVENRSACGPKAASQENDLHHACFSLFIVCFSS